MHNDGTPKPTIISFNEGAKRLNRGRSTIYEQLDRTSKKFNPNLPQLVRDGRSVGFIEHEIDEYIRTLMRARGGAPGQQ